MNLVRYSSDCYVAYQRVVVSTLVPVRFVHFLIKVRGEFYYCGDQQMPFAILYQQLIKRPIVPDQLPFRVQQRCALGYLIQHGREVVESIRPVRR